MSSIEAANFLEGNESRFRYLEKSNPRTSSLKFLTYGIYEFSEGASGALAHPEEEALLFCWKGATTVRLSGAVYRLERYDVLYVPRGATYFLEDAEQATNVIVCRAPAAQAHPVFHGKWEEFSKDERRIRHLKGKDVYLMFDVSEPADKLMAGFTLFRPHQRS